MQLVEVLIEHGKRTMVVRGRVDLGVERVVFVIPYDRIRSVSYVDEPVWIEHEGHNGLGLHVPHQLDVVGEIRRRMEDVC